LVPAFFLSVGGGALVVWDLARREAGGVAPIISPAGLLLVVAGLGFGLAGALTLRRNYSSTLVIRKSHELVVHGIYCSAPARIRRFGRLCPGVTSGIGGSEAMGFAGAERDETGARVTSRLSLLSGPAGM